MKKIEISKWKDKNKYEKILTITGLLLAIIIIVLALIEFLEIYETINPMVKELEFIEEYKGNQIPEGKKSIMFRFKIGNKDSTMTTDQINNKMNAIIKILNKKCGAELRTE